MKTVLKSFLILLLVLVAALGGLLCFLTVTEYKPADTETLDLRVLGTPQAAEPGGRLSVLSWNIGYCGLGQEQDFFMDGGSHARPGSVELVNRYLQGVSESIAAQNADFVLLQEVDSDSSRTYGIDETAALSRGVSAYAMNYSCPFVPIPFPPMGKVHSGLLTTTDLAVAGAQRVSLPCPFSWPLSAANLKRCLLVTRLPLEGTDRELVLVNLHLEAYDDGEGKAAQTRQLVDLLDDEYARGNYVIAGGDFNQSFPGALEMWPGTHMELWTPGVLDVSGLPEGFGYAYDLSAPTCRLLNRPYDPADTEDTQYYTIDGFIVSPNVEVLDVRTVDLGFAHSDHNPVYMEFGLEA